ncbi:hypothetical protein ABT160_12495 [Streptomyces sp. NPDC001941]|uniref:hypothetical protein n=1 Tax=Streptomyces sp. NPDC001941 TaxID=3154659 RepID=UPI00331E5108
MRCGYGWEQAYEIEHHTDNHGHAFCVYKANGERVPSPLSSPTCMNCGGHVVRIMRAGQVSSVQNLMARAHAKKAAEKKEGAEGDEKAPRTHHWHLSDLLHPFHHRDDHRDAG